MAFEKQREEQEQEVSQKDGHKSFMQKANKAVEI